MNIDELKDRMNAHGATGTPFLFAVDFELSEGIFIGNPVRHHTILFRTPIGSNVPKQETFPRKKDRSFTKQPISYDDYRKRFDVVMKGLKRGDSFLTNLTVKTAIVTDLSLKDIFLNSNAPYGLYVPERFVCFSPERFVRIADRRISTNPMKGTINANIPDAEKAILSDPKETAEHHTIVDLLRNDIGMVADDVRVERFRYIDRIRTNEREILQVSSEISGRLESNDLSHLGDILFRMLPAGSVSGAPKASTVKIIRQAEGEPREFYTGIFGYFDGKELDSAVLIRYIEEKGGKKYFRSGGGITVFSNPENEYKEVIEKIYLPFV